MENQDIPQRPAYLDNPIVANYTHQLFHLIDNLYQETDGTDIADEVGQLRSILRVVFTRIVINGEMAELDSILQMHFPIEYAPQDSDSVPSLTDYPLSGSN